MVSYDHIPLEMPDALEPVCQTSLLCQTYLAKLQSKQNPTPTPLYTCTCEEECGYRKHQTKHKNTTQPPFSLSTKLTCSCLDPALCSFPSATCTSCSSNLQALPPLQMSLLPTFLRKVEMITRDIPTASQHHMLTSHFAEHEPSELLCKARTLKFVPQICPISYTLEHRANSFLSCIIQLPLSVGLSL